MRNVIVAKIGIMFPYLLLSIAVTITSADRFFEIADIPIEHFEHEDIQNDAIDVELMPRTSRSFRTSFYNHSPDPTNKNVQEVVENIPEQQEFFNWHFQQGSRLKRQVAEEASAVKLVEKLGKPLELSEIAPEKIEEAEEENTTEANSLSINDFIRFRRSAGKNENVTRPQNVSRGTRGITREQWLRHAYPVRADDEMTYEDNIQESSESEPVPKVHFVTEGMQPAERKYDREARARSLNREISRNLARDSMPEMDYIQPRYTRNYDPWPARDNRYYQDPYQRPNDPYNIPNRQRRIIYYATLPELPRSTPRDLYRGRYDGYRDRYVDDYYRDRYYDDPYYRKPHYGDEKRGKKPEYPVKVEADVSVRGVKKNPDRIYSEVSGNRYAANDMY